MKKMIDRPQKLSDPFADFSKNELDGIISKKDSELDAYDFNCIFQSHLPAGTYSECLYFVPVALNYIKDYIFASHMSEKPPTELENEVSDLVANLIFWCDQHWGKLCDDCQETMIKNSFNNIISEILSDFKLQMNIDGYIYPQFDSLLETLVYAMQKHKFLESSRTFLKNKLLSHDYYISAAWLVVICTYPQRMADMGIIWKL